MSRQSRSEPLYLSGEWRARASEPDLAKRFPNPELPEGEWATVRVPHHWRTAPEFDTSDGPLLYRRHFDSPDGATADDRQFLELDGIFYYGYVWLDGEYLGATEGYVTEELSATGGEEIRWKLEKYLAQSVVHYQ